MSMELKRLTPRSGTVYARDSRRKETLAGEREVQDGKALEMVKVMPMKEAMREGRGAYQRDHRRRMSNLNNSTCTSRICQRQRQKELRLAVRN